MEDKRLSELAEKYLNGVATPEEEAELHRWWDREMNDEEEQIVVTEQPETGDSVRERILGKLNRQIDTGNTRVRRLDRRWLIAAAVLFVVAATAVLIRSTRQKPAEEFSAARQIKPGGNKATLELSTGKTIDLDSAHEGMIADESGARVNKQGGDRLVYSVATGGQSTFNIVNTPKGGQYQVELSDGSKVWLNAASSIRFPTVFEKDRQVELSGEAYFEVAGDPSRPFKVIVSSKPGVPACVVTVLGTAFDISSYSDETTVTTTLLKGSLKVTSVATNRSQLLTPGQQAIVDQEHNLTVNDSPDSAKIVAWHEGLFRFRNDSIEEVMNQVSRWFDVDIVYSGKTTEHFVSTLPRDADLYDDLQILQKTGRVRFEVRGRTVTVFPH